jgi:hypothetical protein
VRNDKQLGQVDVRVLCYTLRRLRLSFCREERRYIGNIWTARPNRRPASPFLATHKNICRRASDEGVTGVYARWHMFEEKREAVIAIEAAVLPLMPKAKRMFGK